MSSFANIVKDYPSIMRLLGLTNLAEREVIVLGAGPIGKAVAECLVRHRANAYLVDPNPLRHFLARRLLVGTARSLEEVIPKLRSKVGRYPLIVIGTTGQTSLSADAAEHLPDKTVLVSMSSKQVEFDLKAFAERGRQDRMMENGEPVGVTFTFGSPTGDRQLHVLGHGYPVNFVGQESVENSQIDPIMCLLLISLLEVAKPAYLPTKDGQPRGRTPVDEFWLSGAANNIYTEFADWLAQKTGMFE